MSYQVFKISPRFCLSKQMEALVLDDISIFEELLVSVYYSFRKKKENKCEPRFNNETLVKVDLLLRSVTDFSFNITFVIILKYLRLPLVSY